MRTPKSLNCGSPFTLAPSYRPARTWQCNLAIFARWGGRSVPVGHEPVMREETGNILNARQKHNFDFGQLHRGGVNPSENGATTLRAQAFSYART